jgi:2-dehydro-3-deoxyphosphogluconate aldolase/(4S)-4-hydroxy-2-oxoglutarate aldolase
VSSADGNRKADVVNDWIERIAAAGIVAVVVVERVEDAVPLGRALVAGGVTAVEVTLRTLQALEVLTAMCEGVPELVVGAGTVIEVHQVERVQGAGAAFAVAPGCSAAIINAARAAGLPFAPGVATPSDIEQAVQLGCRILKFFPAEPSGGLSYLKAVAAPYAQLGLRYIPLGGLSQEHVPAYAKERAVLALGGSWLAPPEAINARAWSTISERAKAAVQAVAEARRGLS